MTTTPSPAKNSLSNFAAISDTFSPATEAPPCVTTLLASDLVAARPAAWINDTISMLPSVNASS